MSNPALSRLDSWNMAAVGTFDRAKMFVRNAGTNILGTDLGSDDDANRVGNKGKTAGGAMTLTIINLAKEQSGSRQEYIAADLPSQTDLSRLAKLETER